MTLEDACSACLSLAVASCLHGCHNRCDGQRQLINLFLLIKEIEVNILVDHTNLFNFDQICLIELGVKPEYSTGFVRLTGNSTGRHPVN